MHGGRTGKIVWCSHASTNTFIISQFGIKLNKCDIKSNIFVPYGTSIKINLKLQNVVNYNLKHRQRNR